MSPALAETLPRRLLDVFLLRDTEKLLRERQVTQQEAVARTHAAAQKRIRIARDLQESPEAVGALTLYREAAILVIAALKQQARTEGGDVTADPATAWSEFDQLSLPAGYPAPPHEFERARLFLATSDPLAGDALSPEELIAATAAAAATVDWLAGAVEPRTIREIRATRVFRIAGVALLLAYVLFKLASLAFASKNVALGKVATASSQRPGTPAATGVNNGVIESAYGVHTNNESNPWVQIDLGASMAIHQVRVYNRGDGWQNEIMPVVLELSDDGKTWSEVARRETLYTRDDPWIAKLTGARARYVRVAMPRPGYIALSEVEVY
jgi:hypothetical protein